MNVPNAFGEMKLPNYLIAQKEMLEYATDPAATPI